MSTTDLFLHEEIMLLALREQEGTIIGSERMHLMIGAAVAAELLIRQKISLNHPKKKLVDLVDSTPVGDPLIDECLEKLTKAKRRKRLNQWVVTFAQTKKIKPRVAEGLVKRGILRVDEGKVLWIFNRKIYPEVDPEPEKAIIERLREAIFTDREDVDPRTIVLLSLAKVADLLKVHFDKKELKSRKKRIEQVIQGEATGAAAQKAIEEIQAAIAASVIITTAAAGASSASSGGS